MTRFSETATPNHMTTCGSICEDGYIVGIESRTGPGCILSCTYNLLESMDVEGPRSRLSWNVLVCGDVDKIFGLSVSNPEVGAITSRELKVMDVSQNWLTVSFVSVLHARQPVNLICFLGGCYVFCHR